MRRRIDKEEQRVASPPSPREREDLDCLAREWGGSISRGCTHGCMIFLFTIEGRLSPRQGCVISRGALCSKLDPREIARTGRECSREMLKLQTLSLWCSFRLPVRGGMPPSWRIINTTCPPTICPLRAVFYSVAFPTFVAFAIKPSERATARGGFGLRRRVKTHPRVLPLLVDSFCPPLSV